ncbi:HAD domain-containing protein [Paraburkholderia tropica]|uniref:HAD domain-containing protein n=1 Tax=Paraburkholderia tropica TaxID=92647 RepID=UPI00159006A1|nr:HAD domain-containing protein [Paraburkholderia tropica]
MNIYLNFDGVLHPDQVFYEKGCIPSLLTPGHSALEYAKFLASALDDYDDIAIVLNTWWTFYLGLDACKNLLPATLASRIIGTTIRHIDNYETMPCRHEAAECHIARSSSQASMILDHNHARYRRDLHPNLLLLDPSEGLGSRAARRSLERRLRHLKSTGNSALIIQDFESYRREKTLHKTIA